MGKKAKSPGQAVKFQDIPNVGDATALDFKKIGLKNPKDLSGSNPEKLYLKLCKVTKKRHDPCTLDVLISAVHFMDGKGARPWWTFTEQRKENFEVVENKLTEMNL